MSEIASARINNFASQATQKNVPASEEHVFILTSRQLQDIITQAVEKVIHHLQNEVLQLKVTVDTQAAKIAALESTQDTQADNQLIQLRLINDLREATKKEPQPLQKDRAEILIALLAANGGKMLAKDARNKMHLRKDLFSQLLKTCDFIEVKPLHSDKRKMVIILKSKLV
jgi:hypothetical protein